jgi:drug/metabolite transporter (DMT)-like permease
LNNSPQHAPLTTWLGAMPYVFVLIWATGFVSAKLAMPHVPPFSFLCWRYTLSILCFGVWIAVSKPAWPQSRRQWLHLAITGMLMHAGYLGGVWAAIKLGMSAGLSALIVGLQPIITAIWISSRGSEVTGRQWLGLLVGFVGLGLVVSSKIGSVETTLVPLAWIVLALLSITVGTLYQKAHVQACDVRTANSVQLMGALLVSLPLALLEPAPMVWHSDVMWALAWSVLGLTLGGSSLMYLLIQRGALTQVTSLLYLVPPTTALIAWGFFNEPLTFIKLLGMAVAAAGVFLVLRPAR